MVALYVVGIGAFIVSFLVDSDRTKRGFQVGLRKFIKILPGYLKILMILAVVLLIPNELIVHYLGESSSIMGISFGAIFGSITMMPGFIAYPLSGVFLEQGVSYMVIASFVTTLMMVGVATYPVEKQYFGRKSTIVRNLVALGIALIISVLTGIFFGELI